MLTWPVMAIGWVMNMIQRGKASMDRLNDIFNEPPEFAEDTVSDLAKIEGSIEFNNLTFTYPVRKSRF